MRPIWILVPVLGAVVVHQSALDNQIKQIDTATRAQALAVGLNLYTGDYDGIYPYPVDINGLKVVTEPYIKDHAMWLTLNPKKSEFRFNFTLAGVAVKDIPEPGNEIMFYESSPWPNRQRVVSFASGSARILSPVDWGRRAISLAATFPRSAEKLPKSLGKRWKD